MKIEREIFEAHVQKILEAAESATSDWCSFLNLIGGKELMSVFL